MICLEQSVIMSLSAISRRILERYIRRQSSILQFSGGFTKRLAKDGVPARQTPAPGIYRPHGQRPFEYFLYGDHGFGLAKKTGRVYQRLQRLGTDCRNISTCQAGFEPSMEGIVRVLFFTIKQSHFLDKIFVTVHC